MSRDRGFFNLDGLGWLLLLVLAVGVVCGVIGSCVVGCVSKHHAAAQRWFR